MRATTGILLIGLAFTTTPAWAQSQAPTQPQAQPPTGGTLTEPQARSVFMNACGNVSTLSQDSHGLWHGVCAKGAMTINADGKVVASIPPEGELTEAQARSLLMNACGNVSHLHRDMKGNWHGVCSKGAMMVDPDGKVVPYTGQDVGINAAHARSLAMSKCSNVAEHMHMLPDGTWMGTCSAGTVMVNQAGEVSIKK